MKTFWLTGAAITSLAIATTTSGDTLDLVRATIANGINSQTAEEENPSQPVEESGFYIQGNLGANLMSDIKINRQQNPVKMAVGVDGGMRFGYQICEWLSVDAQTGVAWNEGRDMAAGQSLTLYQVPVMANVNFTIPLSRPGSERWPFIGVTTYFDFNVGLGAEWTRFDTTNFSAPGMSDKTDDWAFAYQVGTDLRFGLTSNFDLGLFFNFRGTTKVDMAPAMEAKELFNYALGMNFRITF